MKPTKHLITGLLVLSIVFASCQKDDSNTNTDSSAVVESTVELSIANATADFMAEDDNEVLMEAAEEKDLLGNFNPETLESHNLLDCADVTIAPLNGFPKTILINFDSTCTATNGIVRKGTIRIVISDSIRRSGSTAVMTFENYFVNNFKREGTHTWTNTSPIGGKSWQRKIVGGKITAPNGLYWLHESTHDVVQTAGVNTRFILLDDVFSVTGNATIANAAGMSRTANIELALQKKYICRFIDKGRVRFQGPNHFAILDYGDGTCDNKAKISIDGYPPREIVLQ